MEVDEDVLKLNVQIQHALTLFEERTSQQAAALVEVSKNLGEAFTRLRQLEADYSRREAEMEYMSDRFTKLEVDVAALRQLAQKLSDSYLRIAWLSPFATAVITGAVVKAFMG
jgi:predicted nuclease with TOPRIM domain